MEQSIEIVKDWDLKKLIKELEAGHIKIPRFQRDYIWERSKTVKLLNSIYLKYPIGSFFLWIAPKKYNNFIRDIDDLNLPQTDKNNNYQFILDGQQRIISIYVSLKGLIFEDIDYSNICFNIDKKSFVIPRLKREKNNIPAWKIFDEKAFSQLHGAYSNKDKKNKTQYAKILKECREIFLNYPISIVKTLNKDLDDVVEIFERINQGGKKLTGFDLVHATTWSTKFDLKEKIKEFNSNPKLKKYGTLSNKVFTQSLALNKFNDCSNLYQLRLTSEICSKLWTKTKTTINYAINFFNDMGIKNDLSAYHSYIPVIQYYFFISGFKTIKEEHNKEIEKWFWDSKFDKRYATSSYSKIKEDTKWIHELIEN
ncbi:MAG: DUF262 domain-containing protein [Bacteroidales bacterium]|nr:DUF262 domain-containing protein [Bacteroidales bacterium]